MFMFLVLLPSPLLLFSMRLLPRTSTLFPYTTLFRSSSGHRRPPSRISCMLGNGILLRFASLPRQRSEEHTSELQSRFDLVCRLLLEKKKTMATARLDCVSTELYSYFVLVVWLALRQK